MPETLDNITKNLQEKVVDDPQIQVLNLADYVEGVAMLTVNVDNKRAMVDVAGDGGVVEPLLKILEEGHPSALSVKAKAAKALWNLALLDDVRSVMENKHSLVGKLKSAKDAYKHCGDERLIRSVDGVLFECGERDVEAKAKLNAQRAEEVDEVDNAPWVMISYNWGHQHVALHLRDELKARGFKLWIDVDHTQGDVIEAMAEAVEGAVAVVSIMTSAYKQSPNCQSELKYTNKLRKPIVPVVAEPGYRPDGWLGLILGDKLYHDFRKEEKWAPSIEGVVRELSRVTAASEVPSAVTKGKGNREDAKSPPLARNSQAPTSLSRECIRCGCAFGESFKFCGMCGSRCLCVYCGATYMAGKGQLFCQECGKGISAASTSPEQAIPKARPKTPRANRERVLSHYVKDQDLRGVLTTALSQVLATTPPDPLRVLSEKLLAAHEQTSSTSSAHDG